MDQWRVPLNMAMNIHVHKMSKIPSWPEQHLISQGRATASVVSHRPLTADASGAFHSSSCEIRGGQTSIEIGGSPNKTLVVGITYLLTPWSRVLLEKLTGSAASQEIPPIFGTRRFIIVLTSARHLSLT